MPEKMTPACAPALPLVKNSNSIRTDDRVSGNEHQRYVFVGLLDDLQDLGSKTFRDHWWYRARMWYFNTNTAFNPERQRDWEYLLMRAREYKRRNTL